MKVDWKTKLTSRKFWAMVVNLVTNILIVAGASETAIVQIVAIIMASAGVIAYIIGEGLVDRARAAADVDVFTFEGTEDVDTD